MSVVASPPPILQFFNNAGQPNVGGSILTQVGGVNAATYQDSAGAVPLPNPIPLNSRGEISNASGLSCQLFLTPNTAYTFTIFDANGNQVGQASYVNGVQVSITQASVAQLLNPQTAAEAAVAITPSSLVYPPGNAFRYNVDPTGTADSTTAMQQFINASWAGLTYGSPWPGSGQANMVATLPPARVKTSGYLLVPCNITLTGAAHPGGNTESHTRIILNSTGVTPGRTWSALATIPNGGHVVPTVSNGYYYTANAGNPAGVTGATQPSWPTTIGNTVVDGTVTWTCTAAVTAGDNRNTPMLKFSRAVSPSTYPSGGSLADANLNTTIQNLEFWSVTPGSTFAAPLSGASNIFGDYPLGAAIYVDVTSTDCRVVSCVFQNLPCAFRVNAVNSAVSSQGDGFAYNGSANWWFEECEFDAGGAHVYCTNSNLDLVFRNCSFYGGVHKYVGCTGRVVYENCRFYGNAYIDATDTGNNFSLFRVNGGPFDLCTAYDSISVYGANILDIKGLTMQSASGTSAIVANTCNGGSISLNSINDAGYNAGAGSSILNYIAAIKLIDCFNVLVAANNVTTTDAASYGGFGILTGVNVRNSIGNLVTGNAVSGSYSGAVLNGQYRYINLSTGDYRGQNYENRSSGPMLFSGPTAVGRYTLTYSASITPNFGLGAQEFDITATNGTAFTINNPIGYGVDSQELIIIIRNTSGGALGTITWGTIYKMLAFTSPVNGSSATIRFRFDGTNWVQTMPQTVNVPN